MIFETGSASAKPLSISGTVLAIDETKSFLFYLKKKFGSYYAVRLSKDTADSEPVEISVSLSPLLKRFTAHGGNAAVLALEPEKKQGSLSYVYFDEGVVKTRNDIIDVRTAGGELLFLENFDGGTVLDFGGNIIPCGISAVSISHVIGGQIAVVTDGEISEIIDIQRGKNIYSFSRGVDYALPSEYNLVFE
ncbi:MAG: hypothetical protein LBT84_06370, partial [Spirochaetia bacterium]|nr:hypothetical protein [Spirochaetia bacterium]